MQYRQLTEKESNNSYNLSHYILRDVYGGKTELNGWQTQRLLDLFVSNMYAVLQKSGLTHRVTLFYLRKTSHMVIFLWWNRQQGRDIRTNWISYIFT